ncbi:MFS transporter [Microbacterium sp. 13-71-7]|jgi:predicted MFS family arabinose efflux permease|uniref:MFS transporter n=1 Tax=Microbacterium sp. 13-71-7 TaxID=1970399 RepID=UPI000BDB81BC|nr:MFS transporter [Microbacterium sp. 13-71-7]OZB84045.1 MAG: MFS transporter [Microbacterium sp. 13-71-7]
MSAPESAPPVAPPAGTPTSVIRAEKAAHVPHRWRNLYTLTGMLVVDSTEGGLTATLFPTIAKALGLDNGHLGLLAAAGKIISVPFGPAWVWISGRTSRRTALALSTALAGAFGIAAGFSNDFLTLLIFNTLMAAALIGAQPIANAVVSDLFDDKNRARAVGIVYGAGAGIGALLSPLIAQLSHFADGWRWGMWALGGVCILAGVAILALFKDPGVGAAEKQLAGLDAEKRAEVKPTFRSVMSLFRIPSYVVMMVSRLLSGHLLIGVFGIQFLVTVRGFDNATAAIAALPFGIGYFLGTLGGGFLVGVLDRRAPQRGRVAYIQAAQVLFAVVAFFGTQFAYTGIGVYALIWGLIGIAQGMNPGVNRPIIMAITLPELRGQAFAIMITIFEAIGWALFSIGAGFLANALGLQTVFLWVLVILMLVNAAVLGILYRTYPRDVRRVADELEARRLALTS